MEIMRAHPRPADAALLHRIAALGDKDALLELDARHGMTLYAIAYAALLDPGAADAAVAAAPVALPAAPASAAAAPVSRHPAVATEAKIVAA
jgi:hypothetical protein